MYLSRFCKQPLIDGSTLCDRLYCCALQVYYTCPAQCRLQGALLVCCTVAQPALWSSVFAHCPHFMILFLYAQRIHLYIANYQARL